jgi:hypothetical protein
MNKQFVRALFASTCFVTVSGAWVNASMAAAASAVPVVANGIGGTVTGAKGPEAGVWVIAETHDLPTKFIKIVVTDDQGRYMLPELPKAKYDVWVRGYGLVDSPHVAGTPGKNLDLKSVQAPDAKAAAEYYPANYWLALMKIPAESEFPGTGPKGNGIAINIKTQQQWLQQLKGCQRCHQQGDKTTRTLLNNTPEGWAERITKQRAPGDQAIGNTGPEHAAAMQNQMAQFGRTRGLGMFADFTQRIAKGELPPVPPRPQGIERNIVLTSWDWGNGRYIHDLTSTDRNNPTMNANGNIYGITAMQGFIEVLNPEKNEQSEFGYRVDETKGVVLLTEPDPAHAGVPHNPMLDSEGRLWLTDRGFRDQKDYAKAPPKMPYCNDPNAGRYAKYYPQNGKATATLVVYDPKTKAIAGASMCNTLHHLMQATDGKMYTSGADLASWVDVKEWDKSHDQAKAVGWCPFVLDTNSKTPSKAGALNEMVITPDRMQWNQPAANGRRQMDDPESTAVGGPEAAPIDPTKDTRISGGTYGMDVDVTDGGIWYGRTGPWPSSIVKFNPGTNPPETCRAEVYESAKLPDGSYEGFNIRGMSVDSKGVAWAAFAQGRLGKLDRTKCKVLTGPTATGQQCPEGWKYYDVPGPGFAGVKNAKTDFAYLMWVDLHDTLGLGKDIPIVTGSNSDSLLAFDPKVEKWTVLRVPYPMDFHTRGMDGRIDSTAAGWKGKGVYATYAMQPVWHEEGGDDGLSGPTMVKFQVRPDPLAY